jgi:hypothetical protein
MAALPHLLRAHNLRYTRWPYEMRSMCNPTYTKVGKEHAIRSGQWKVTRSRPSRQSKSREESTETGSFAILPERGHLEGHGDGGHKRGS